MATSRRPAPSRLSRFVVEALEPRLLYSADVGPSLLGAVVSPVAEQRLVETDPAPAQPQAATQTQAREVVFVDAATPDADRLIAEIQAQPGRAIDVVRIGADEDGLARIGAELAARQDVSAVHIISHGSDGMVRLGTTTLDSGTLQARGSELAAWSGSLTSDADVLIYGCDVAQDTAGEAFLQQLARLTGADVAASTNLTGTTALGGDFALEFRTGTVETQTVLNEANTSDWRGLLAVTADTSSSAATDTPVTSLTFSHTVSASGSDGFLLVTVGTVNGAQAATSVTYGGVALTRIGGITESTGKVSVEMWGLKDPAAGTADVVVNIAGPTSVSAGATTFFGVDQTTPYSAAAFSQGGGGTASVTLASAPGELVVDGVVGQAISTFDVGANQTELWSELAGNTPSDPWNASSTEAGAASVTMSWTKTGSGVGHWASGALSLLAADPNAAPVLTGANPLASIAEDATTNSGTSVSSLIAGQTTDTNASALTGIAVTGVDNTNGNWQYSTNAGVSWSSFGAPTDASARLLAADATTYVRFVPNADWSGTVPAGLTFRAWDQTSGIAGGTANVSTNGGSTAFSAASATSGISVTPVNDAPVNTIPGSLATPFNTPLVLSGSNRISVADVDAGSNPLQVTLSATNGTLTLATTSGLTFSTGSGTGDAVMKFEGTLASINTALDGMQFTPIANYTGGASIQITSEDLASNAVGNTVVFGASSAPGAFDKQQIATRITLPTDGTLTSITAYLDNIKTDTVSYGIYTDAGGEPGTLLAQASATLPAGSGWYTLQMPSVALTSGNYWIGLAPDKNGSVHFSATGGDTRFSNFDPKAGLSSPSWTGTYQSNTESLSVYASVTPSGGTSMGDSDTVAISVGANTAPVLSGANGLTSIVEDTATNPGTLVSALLAGHLSDADTGALTGIAVTGVDNTNGAWQYSTDGGSTWTAFGSPTAATARLLAADGNTYVRFVPNANFNGTVPSGLTFRAWDLTSGVSGGTADTTSASLTVSDTFTAASYSNNDGTASWSTSWVDADGNPAAGNIRVTGGELVLSTFLGTESVYRQVDLSGASGASLSFSYDNQLGLLGSVSLQVSNDGGATYGTLATFSSGANTGSGTYTADLGAYMASDTRVRFQMSGTLLGGSFHVDNVQVAYTKPLSGGTTAFSSSTASSGITVAAVNDAPSGVTNTVTTLEDTAYVFAASDFGFSDTDGNAFAGVKFATLPGAGILTNNGVAVTAGQTVAAADIAAGHLSFIAAPDANGAPYTSFTFQVQDNGGTANGGVDLDPIARTMTVNVTPVNDAPIGKNVSVTTLEDTAYVFANTDFGFSDPDGNSLLAVRIASLPTAGVLTDNGVAVSLNQQVSAADIAAGSLRFTPAPNGNGAGYATFKFQVRDNGGTANGGVDFDPAVRTMTVDVTPVNDAPAGADNTVTTLEDTDYVFTAADFGFTDIDGGVLTSVDIGSLPVAGTLTDNGVAVVSGQWVSAADIAAGLLRFTPAANANGAGYASFTFQVRDDGGTANGGVAVDPAARTMTVNVTAVNDAPAAASNTVTTLEDTAYVFAAVDFGFSDADGNTLAAVKIDSLPAAGTLTNNGVAVSSGQWVSAADIAAGLLRFTPAANANGAGYASFSFQVQDDGGTANGGVDLDPTARTMTVNVTSVNDAPGATNNTVTTAEDTAYVFAASDFGFSDTDGNALLAVKISSLPTAGTLTDNGVAVSSGQLVSAADIAAGLLRFTPAANANGAGYASFTFQVQDDGGTASGGADLDPIARTITVDVAAVNDAPSGASNTVTALEDGAHVFTAADFGFSDADGNALSGVKIAALPGAGALTNNGVAVSAGQVVSAADIAAGLLRFTPTPNANGAGYASFTFQVQDNGGSANGGTDLDPTARTMSVNVTPVNDAPTGTNNAIVMQQDGTYAFSTTDFGFSDSDGNAFAGVVISTVPPGGLITDNGAPVAAGQTVSAGDIAAGLVRYTPTLGASGMPYASFTFRVQDSGGAANGGADTDAVARTMTINVASAASVGPVVGPVAVPAPPAKVQSQPPAPIAPAATNANTPALAEQAAPAAASARLLLASNDVLGTRVDVDEGFRFQTVSAAPLASVFATAQRLTGTAPAAAPAFGSPGSAAVSDEKQFEFQLFGSMQVSDRAGGGSGSRAAGLAGELDRVRDELGEQGDLHHWVSGSIAAGSFGLTVGYVLWLLRGGALVASLLSSLPAWRLIDPLPVLSRVDDEEDADEDQDAFVSFAEANPPFPVAPEKS